jgi:hypothetical protein
MRNKLTAQQTDTVRQIGNALREGKSLDEVATLVRSLPRWVLVELREVILDIRAEDEYAAARRTL